MFLSALHSPRLSPCSHYGVSQYPSGLPRCLSGKESACRCGRCRRLGLHPWVETIFQRRAWQPTPVLLPGKPCGQRSLAGTVHGVAKSRTRLSDWVLEDWYSFLHVHLSSLVARTPRWTASGNTLNTMLYVKGSTYRAPCPGFTAPWGRLASPLIVSQFNITPARLQALGEQVWCTFFTTVFAAMVSLLRLGVPVSSQALPWWPRW